MCRFFAYQGEPVSIADLVCTPVNSLLQQSRCAQEGKTTRNEDGFGIGWYNELPEPWRRSGVAAAWANDGIRNACDDLQSRLFFAHVRASTGTMVSQANCHPFAHHQWLFMHNGQIGGYEHIQEAVEAIIPKKIAPARRGTTDSEAIFLAAVGNGLPADPIAVIIETLAKIQTLAISASIAEPIRFSAALTDGTTLYAFRWASDGRAPRIYYRNTPTGLVIASEPSDGSRQKWFEIANGCTLIARAGSAPTIQSFGAKPMRAAA